MSLKSGNFALMLATLNHDSEVVLIMNKQLIRNEMLYQMSIQPAKIMLEKSHHQGGVQENEGLPPSEI